MTEPWEDALLRLMNDDYWKRGHYQHERRRRDCLLLRSTIEGLTAEREQLTRMRDMLAVMGADFADEVLGGSGATPEDWLAEAERRLMKLDALCAAPDDLPTDDERMNAANEAFALGEADCAAPEGSEG